jgi:hypothetical protein
VQESGTEQARWEYGFEYATLTGAQLDERKVVRWDCNIVVDALGRARLVRSLKGLMQTVREPIIPDELKELYATIKAHEEFNFGNVYSIKDRATGLMRYLYKVSESRDSTETFYSPALDGFYVDIENGTVFADPSLARVFKVEDMYFPIDAISLADLTAIKDKLNIAVQKIEKDGVVAEQKLVLAPSGRILESLVPKTAAPKVETVKTQSVRKTQKSKRNARRVQVVKPIAA